ncbi:toll/interleukin-1 receptor domain-containing protein [uncultured Deefgea sp.]|uniref:toll/interleukin-1 receptor domain-containing protein n=1 Tax=uncultured Deefgea sp. TaxID=1304914 RepID=UPI0025945823|nr:toll/interleukin-1 receptor domain-containing protein [uncultured Deefgea sp.]
MKVFISWSGDLSRDLAEELRIWLPAVLQNVKPFFTPNDIEKGARWSRDIAKELEESAVGIFCLTKENLNKPWIMFEAGALSKRVESSKVCPVLFGVDNAELEGPLVQFQASPFSEAEIKKLIKTINSCFGEAKLDDGVLNTVFEMWWPKLNEKISKIMENHKESPHNKQSSRTEREILEEVLELSRLSVSSSRRNSRSVSEPKALLHAINSLKTLATTSVEMFGESILVQQMEELLEPLEYLSRRSDFSSRVEAELINSAMEVREVLDKFKL